MGKSRRRKGFRPLRRTPGSKINVFGTGARLKKTEDTSKYLYPLVENSYPRDDQLNTLDKITSAEYAQYLGKTIESKINKTFLRDTEKNRMYGQFLLGNSRIQNALSNYRKLSSIVKVSDKTAGMLGSYLTADDIANSAKQEIIASIVRANNSSDYGAVQTEYTTIKKALDEYFYKKRFQQNQRANLQYEIQQNPFSKIKTGINSMPVFMDLQGGLKGAQIEKTAFM